MPSEKKLSSIAEEVFFTHIIPFLNWKTIFTALTHTCKRWNFLIHNTLLSQSIQIINKLKRDEIVVEEYFTILLQTRHIQKFIKYTSRELRNNEDVTLLLKEINRLQLQLFSPEIIQFLNTIVLNLPVSSQENFPHLPFETQHLISIVHQQNVFQKSRQTTKEMIYTQLNQTPILNFENPSHKAILYALRRGIDPFVQQNLNFTKQFALQCVTINGYVFKYFCSELQNDRDIALAAVKSCPKIYCYLSSMLKRDEQIAIEAFSRAPIIAHWETQFFFKKNVHFYRKVLDNIHTICVSKDSPLHNLDLWIDFTEETSTDVDKELLHQLALKTLDKFCGIEYPIASNFEYSPNEVEKWQNVLKKGISILDLIQSASMKDRIIVKMAIENDCTGFETILLQNFTQDREMILLGLHYNGLLLKQLDNLQDDKQIVLTAVQQNPISYIYASKSLQMDSQIKSMFDTLLSNQIALQQQLQKKHCPNIKQLDWTDCFKYDSIFGMSSIRFVDKQSRFCNIYFGKKLITRFERFLSHLKVDNIATEVRLLSLCHNIYDVSKLLCYATCSFVKVFTSESDQLEMGMLHLHLSDGGYKNRVIYLLDYKYDEYLFVGSHGSHPYVAHNTFRFINSDGSGPEMMLHRNYTATKTFAILKHYYLSYLTDKVYRYDRMRESTIQSKNNSNLLPLPNANKKKKNRNTENDGEESHSICY